MSNPLQCKPFPAANNRRYAYPALLLAMMVTEAAHGDVVNGKHHFDIPAQPLNQALLQFGRQSQQQLMYSTDMVEKLSSHALQGDYRAAEAISILLADSPLQAVTTGEGTMTLQPKAMEYHNRIQPEALPPVKVDGTAEYDSTDPYNTDYTRPNASTATKTDTPIMETPFAVQVVPKQVMQDQQAVRLEAALENVSGTYSSRGAGGIGGGQSATFIRGFETFEYYRDGTRFNGGFNINGPRELANIERIEVLKGPASILYGRLEPGGMVNIVTKRPLDTSYYSMQQQFGSFDFYRTTADATGPMTQDKSLLYRVNLSYENSGSFREFLQHDRVFFAPTFHWTISDKTQANFHMEYQHDKSPYDHGFPVGGNRPLQLPRDRNLGEPGSRNESETFNVGFDWSHAFNDNWTLRHRFDAMLLPKMDTLPSVYSGFLSGPCSSATGCQVNRLTYANHGDSENYSTTLDLLGKFDTWGIKHNILVGGDFFHQANQLNFAWAFSQPIDAFHPVHSGVDPSVLDHPNLSGPSNFTEEWGGFYTQDQIELPYHVHLLAGFRYDTVRFHEAQELHFNFGAPFTQAANNVLQQEAVKPRFGILYQPIPEVSFYGNYVENFGTSNGFNANSVPLPPTSAKQWEGGVKTELFNKRLTTTLAWFDITKQNIAVPDADPIRAASGFQSAVGEVRNQGIEFDVAGELLPGWNVIGNYSYIDSKITKDSAPIFDANFNAIGVGSGNQGNRLFNVPRNLASLWTTYEFLGGDLRGLKFGGGVLLRSQRQGDNANTFQLPGYATVNLLASYSINVGKSKITTQLNIDNLLNKYYFDSATNSTVQGNYPGAPRTVLGSIRLEF